MRSVLRSPFLHLSVLALALLLPSLATAGAAPQQPEDNGPPEVAEKKQVDDQIASLRERITKLTKLSASVAPAQPETVDLIRKQQDESCSQLSSLTLMSKKLQAILEISSLLPEFSGSTAVAANRKLVDLRFQLAQARGGQLTVPPVPCPEAASEPKPQPADSPAPATQPTPAAHPDPSSAPHSSSASIESGASQPAPATTTATTPAPQTTPQQNNKQTSVKDGALWGRILDDITGKPIPNAKVIARCGDNGDAEYDTSTDTSGIYQFSQITATPCLVRATKYLSSAEEQLLEKGKPTGSVPVVESREGNRAVVAAVNQADAAGMPPIGLRSYQSRTIKNILPDTTGTSSTAVEDIRLTGRRASLGEFARTIVGFEQSGASSAPSVQKFFTDFWVSVPVGLPKFMGGKKPKSYAASLEDFNFGNRLRLWGDFRITSVPQQISSSVGDFAIGFANQIGAVKVNQVAQATEFMIGSEYRLYHWGATSQRFLSFDQSTRERFAAYFTVGYGTVTPLNPKDSIQVFNNPTPGSEPAFDQQIANLRLTSQLAGKPFVAFVPDDRYRFFRQYYGGIRVKTFYYDRDTDEPLGRFPASFEAVVGQNETVTGGRLRGPVLRLEGFYPLPYDAIHYLYLFGTADLLLGGQRGGNAIILQPATNAPAVPDPTVFLIRTPQLNRDHYRLGVGIDFLQLVDAIKNRGKNNPAVDSTTKAPATPSPQTP